MCLTVYPADGRNPNYHSNLGNALQNKEKFDEAISCYDKALALEPEYAEAYYNRGNALQSLNQL